ncbi:LOW QUALITY PROTEIN: uncharacterized protein [Centruroides vittatus]|uniref:LOW QUALITY PROTEIN: uncharacterized protein n=1 Tax=Centruroides vittatus TaxID=120091 RepID=UPI00350FE3FE
MTDTAWNTDEGSAEGTTGRSVWPEDEFIVNPDTVATNAWRFLITSEIAGYQQLLNPLKLDHNVTIDVRELNFGSFKDFTDWKSKMEMDSNSHFILVCGSKTIGNIKHHYYTCNCMGDYKQKVDDIDRKRILKSQGTTKLNMKCTAYIAVDENIQTGQVAVKFCGKHYSHEQTIAHIPLNKTTRISIAAKLRTGIALGRITQDLRQFSSPTGYFLAPRSAIVSKKDINNIKKQYNISGIQRHHGDHIKASPAVSSNYLMSDDASWIFTAYEVVFVGHKTQKLLCSWHVERAWHRAILEKVQKEKQEEIYNGLRLLLHTQNEREFNELMPLFLQNVPQEFFDYFMNMYANRNSEWAAWNRKNSLVNTNMYVESFHRLLKHGKTHNKRMDALLHVLIKLKDYCSCSDSLYVKTICKHIHYLKRKLDTKEISTGENSGDYNLEGSNDKVIVSLECRQSTTEIGSEKLELDDDAMQTSNKQK